MVDRTTWRPASLLAPPQSLSFTDLSILSPSFYSLLFPLPLPEALSSTVIHSFTYWLFSPSFPLFLLSSSFNQNICFQICLWHNNKYHLHCCPVHRNVLVFVYEYKYIYSWNESFMHQDLPILNMTHSGLSHSIQIFFFFYNASSNLLKWFLNTQFEKHRLKMLALESKLLKRPAFKSRL